MAKRVQRRRGSTTEHNSFTGAEGEVTVDTTIDTLVVHDGSTPGGHPLGKADGSNLDLTNQIGIIQLNVADGQAGWFLKTDGAGTLSFAEVDVGGTALGGSKLGGTINNATIDANAVGVTELNVTEGTAGYFLKTDGAGGLSFAAVVTDPSMAGDVGGTTSANVIGAGKVLASHLATPLKDFTVDTGVGSLGVDTFALSSAPGSVNAIIVYVDGIVQPPSAYSLGTNPNQITFTVDPPVDSVIRIVHLGFQSTVGTPSDGSITHAKLATNSVQTDNIVNLTIATGDIADDAITGAKIYAQTITESLIAPNTITNISIANATVTGTQIADNAVDGTKISIAGNVAGDIMSYDGTNWVRNIAGNVQGDILYHNGTSWVRLPAGTATHVLTTTGAGANPYWAAGSSGTALPSVGADGNVLTSDGTNWASEAPAIQPNGIYKEEMFVVDSVSTSVANTGTWTKGAGVTSIEVFCTGAGGRGGGAFNPGTSGSPGGSGGVGGFSRQVLDVTNITSLEYHLGRGWNTAQGPTGSQGTGLTAFGKNESLTYNALTVTVVAGAITAIAFSGATIGSGLTQVPLIGIEPNAFHLTGKLGTGAIATAVVAGGAVTGITINNGGSGYVTGQTNAYFGLCGGNRGTDGGPATGIAPGADGSVGVGWGSIGSMGFYNSGPKQGMGGNGNCIQGLGGLGTHGCIWIKSYK